MTSIRIKGIAVYHPEQSLNNDEVATASPSESEFLVGLWKHFGRDTRYVSPDNETSLDMAVQAATKVLVGSGLTGEDLDMIVVSSGTHEYSIPTDASFVHNAVGGKESCIVYDQNANCVGMVVAYDQMTKAMLGNRKVTYALLVGSEQLGRYYADKDLASKGLGGDAACAILLEKVEEDGYGVLDSEYYTHTAKVEDLKLPGNGLSTTVAGKDEGNKIKLADGYNVNIAFPTASVNIEKMLENVSITKEDVSAYLLSQLNINVITDIANALGEDLEKFIYIGDQYGYTGTSSPFIALSHALMDGRVSGGDNVVLWSVGAGITSCGLVVRL